MGTIKTMKVYQWLMDNKMYLASPALVNEFDLMGELKQEVVLEFLGKYFRNPIYVLGQMNHTP